MGVRTFHKKPEGALKYRGVTWDSSVGKWRCRLMVGGEYHYLGWYTSAKFAACIYDRAKMKAKEDVGGRLQRKAKTNAELGLIDPLTPEEFEYLDGLIDEALATKG
jgi:hypothetical protein